MIKPGMAIIFLAVSAATVARAQEQLKWGEAGEWAILIDPSVGNGCLMEKQFDEGTLVQFGNVPDRSGGFLAIYNPDWADIKDGATGMLKLEFPKIRFAGDVVGVATEGRFGGYAFFDNPNVMREFSRNNDMTVVGELGRTIEVSLSGTSNAIKAVTTCQGEQSE